MCGMKLDHYLKLSPHGERTRIAKAIGVSPVLVTQWLTTRGIPNGRVIHVARATGWRVTPHELCPSIYPHPDDGLPPSLRGHKQGDVV